MDEGEGDEEREDDAEAFRSLIPGRIDGVVDAGGGVVDRDDENEFFECDDDESC